MLVVVKHTVSFNAKLVLCKCKWLRKFLPIPSDGSLDNIFREEGGTVVRALWWNMGSKEFRMSHAPTLAVTVVSTEIQRLDK